MLASEAMPPVLSSAARVAALADIAALFVQCGDGLYVNEAISQRAHGEQAAACAAAEGASREAIIGALLHDVGHMVGLVSPGHARMGDCGIVAHEGVGAAWLAARGLPRAVCAIVRGHVAAKRYLVATRPGYFETLSPASVTTLGYQGGPMSAAEAADFAADPLAATILQMRTWDERAKDPAAAVPALETYWPMIAALMDEAQAEAAAAAGAAAGPAASSA